MGRHRLIVCIALLLIPQTASADAIKWPQPGGPGSAVHVSYSYANLLDGTLETILTPATLRTVVEESLGTWAAHAPLHFFEVPDVGPPPADVFYEDNRIQVRFGHHDGEQFSAHAYFPDGHGLAGDVHLRSDFDWIFTWGLGEQEWEIDTLSVLVHEIGHAVGLPHVDQLAIMNPSPPRYRGLGTARLYPSDIAAIQSLYGAGIGSVTPLEDAASVPEPGTLSLITAGVLFGLRRAVRRRRPRFTTGTAAG